MSSEQEKSPPADKKESQFEKEVSLFTPVDKAEIGAISGLLLKLLSTILIIVGIVAVLTFTDLGFIMIEPGRVGIKVNFLTGDAKIFRQPGNKFYIPFIEKIFILDASPQKFTMKGDKSIDANNVKKLTVRSNDGSNFFFDEVVIHYQLLPNLAHKILSDSGPGNRYKELWLKPYVRTVLRNEFGRYTTIDIANATTYNAAKNESKRLLNKLLKPHGVEIIEIVTPKPRFETRYEDAIEDRNLAQQEIEKQKAKERQLQNEMTYRLAKIERQKNREYQTLLGKLVEKKLLAEKEQVEKTRSADAYRIKHISLGEAKRSKMLAEARAKTESHKKGAEGLKAMVDGLSKYGPLMVKEIISRRLKELKIKVSPFNQDGSPKRIIYEELKRAKGNR